MKLRLLAFAAAIACATPLAAQEAAVIDTAETERDWRLSVSGGVSAIADQDDQAHLGLSLTRQFGSSYVQLGVTHVDSGLALGVVNPVPAKVLQGTLAAGTSFDAFSLDGYVTLGDRNFEKELVGPGGQRATVEAGGTSFGIGIALTYDIPVGENGFLSPYVSLDYHAVDIARVVTVAGGNQLAITERREGWSGSLGLAYAHMFGEGGRHSISPYASWTVSSDNTAFAPGPGGIGLAQTMAVRGGGVKDQWGDLGISASFGLTDALRLRLSAAQTLGFEGPESTSLATGLSIAF
jgi:hypothetical protein